MTSDVLLRDVTEGDLPIFFEDQLDPDAIQMVAFVPRDREAFMAHWTKILGDDTTTIKTILFHGQVAGYIMKFEHSGKQELGYWIGKSYWGKGVATKALAEFLDHVKDRPLYASVATHNIGSLRVLEKCGFTIVGEVREFSSVGGKKFEGFILRLGADETNEA